MQTDASVEILADLPGVPKRAIQITVENNYLTLQVNSEMLESVESPCPSRGRDERSIGDGPGDSPRFSAQLQGSIGEIEILKSGNGDGNCGAVLPGSETAPERKSWNTSYWQPKRSVMINERQRTDMFEIRKIQLQANTNGGNATATLTDGVLRIVVPKVSGPTVVKIA